tara:strand:- start:138 stop:506 length:369 start_codon:yes stop_codon:yes gene_type:complete
MKSKKPIFKIIDSGIYPYQILFTVQSTETEVVKYLKKRFILDDEEISYIDFNNKGGRAVQFKNGAMLLWVKDKYAVPVIGHEIFHITEFVMSKVDIPLNNDTSEAYAYLIEHLWKQILKAIQ